MRPDRAVDGARPVVPGPCRLAGSATPIRSVTPRVTAVLGLLALIVAAFSPLRRAEFINIDDPAYVTGNSHVLAGLSPRGVLWAFTSFDSANWHPLTWISHMTDLSLFGLRPGAHHAVNVGLHAFAAILLLLVLERLTGTLWPSLLAAALFAIHPLRVESVAWIAERKDVLSGVFGMLTLVAYASYVRRPRRGRYLAAMTCFVLGLMTKPMLVTLPFVLLILDWWPLARLRRRSFPKGAPGMSVGPALLLEKLPFLTLSAASGAMTYLAQRRGGAVVSTDVFPIAARLGNATVSYVSYLWKLVVPRHLIPFYPHPGAGMSYGAAALALLLLAGLSAGVWRFRGRHPWLGVGWLWFLGTLVPVIGLVQVGLQGMADRYSYLPSIGLCMAVAWEARTMTERRARKALVAGAAAALVILTLLTRAQAGYWKDTATLLNRVIAVDPRNYFAFNMLGAFYLREGETARALGLFAKALDLRPEYYVARYNFGLALAQSGRADEALTQFTAVVRFNPRDAEALFNRGKLLLEKGRVREALRDFDAALAVNPDEPQLHLARDRALARMGRETDSR